MKKIIPLLSLLTILLLPLQFAQATVISQLNTAQQVFDNLENAMSSEMQIFVDGEAYYDSFVSFNADIDISSLVDENDKEFARFDVEASLRGDGINETVAGSLIVIDDTFYVQERGGDWHFLQGPSLADELGLRDLEDFEQDSFTDYFEIIKGGLFITSELPSEFINGSNHLHYGYQIDTDVIIDYYMDASGAVSYVDQNDIIEAKQYLNDHLNVSGEIWINPSTLYPYKATLNVDVDDLDGISATVNFTVLFNSFNQELTIEAPENAIDVVHLYELDDVFTFNSVVPVVTSELYDKNLTERLHGRILLQVEQHGEAWYVREKDSKRYYMRDGGVAYDMMRYFSLGITDADLAKVPSVQDTEEMNQSTSVCASNALANRLRGEIVLQVEQHGEAWYVDPVKCRKIYLKDGDAAYEVMRYLSIGITDADLAKIPVGANVITKQAQ